MHELSIVMSIIDIAAEQAKKAGADVVDEIDLEIGQISGVEMGAFEFAWQQAIKGTLLANSKLNIQRTEGKAQCLDCSTEYPMENLYDVCPQCNSQFHQILSGKGLRVKSLIVP
ncbi:MAG: hypothetical protein RLY16_22 [Bacteroidota bacterium]|jgi:hydrogenase nickel incorporation protein HypA/HybF